MRDSAPTRRVTRTIDVRLRDAHNAPLLDVKSHAVNLAESGLLMYLPLPCEAVEGEDVLATLRWPGGEFTSTGRIVRFESPCRGDPKVCVMSLHLASPLPAALLEPPAPDIR
jgi:hypothetical protein